MELTDPRLLEQLTDAYRETNLPRSRRPRMTRNAVPGRYQPPSRKLRRCGCGKCAGCIENQRWERIFNEKFADPAYYSGLSIKSGSPLHLL